MADRKISDLTALTTPASGDFLPIVDVSEAAAASKNKRITIEELFRGVPLGTAAAPSIAIEGDEDTGVFSPGANQLAVSTGGTERARIDTSGRLLVGTFTSRQSRLGTSNFQTQFQLESNATQTGLATSRFNDSAGSSFVNLQKGRGTIASPAAVIANDITGTIVFSGWDGAAFTNSALIRSEVDGTPGADDMPGRLVFFVTGAGAAGSTERLRITSAGLVGIATSAPTGTLHVNGSALNTPVLKLAYTASNNNTGNILIPIEVAQNTTAGGAVTATTLKITDTSTGGTFPSTKTLTGLHVDVSGSTYGIKNAAIFEGGKVGIGTTSPGQALDVVGSINLTGNHIFSTTTSPLIAATAASSVLRFGTGSGGTERARIDSSGRLGIGTSAPSQKLTITDTHTLGLSGNAIHFYRNSGNYFILEGGSGAFFQFRYGSTDLVKIDSSGNVGIGTTSPAEILHVNGAANPAINITGTSGSAIIKSSDRDLVYDARFGTHVWRNNGNEQVRIDSSGRLLVGTSSELAGGSSTTLLQVAASTGGLLAISRSGATTNAGDTIGEIAFFDNESGNDKCAAILCAGDLDHASGDKPSRLVFSTTADGAASPTERMRITATGRTSCFSSEDAVYSRTAAAAGTSIAVFVGAHTATNNSNGTASSIIWSNGNIVNTNNSYGAISDIKLKENIVDANSQWDDLKALQVRNYNFKEGQTHTQIGLVAQEVELVSPGLVSESPNRDAEGNDLGTVTKSVNYSVLYMKAVKALQEAMERIETLEQRLNDAGIN
jgi:hypothetical protein